MIPRTVANRFANVMGVDLHIAQQEVVLLYAFDTLAAHGLVDHLVFKGGTYVRMMVTGDSGRRGNPDGPGRERRPEDTSMGATMYASRRSAVGHPFRDENALKVAL